MAEVGATVNVVAEEKAGKIECISRIPVETSIDGGDQIEIPSVSDKEEEFKSPVTGKWDISKFGLFKTYKKIPIVTDIQIIDGGGVLPPGSYNFSIKYLDADFNPT